MRSPAQRLSHQISYQTSTDHYFPMLLLTFLLRRLLEFDQILPQKWTHINDLKPLGPVTTVKYVDDTNVLHACKDPGDPTLQEAASYLSDWSRRNHMKFNIKSKEIIFVQSSINVAMYDSTPSRIISGRLHTKNLVRWSPELQEEVKRSKDAHFIWKREGRGSSGSWHSKKAATKEVRSTQRRRKAA